MSKTIAKPFTQSWIQALMQAADQPVTRTIKPSLEWIDKVSLSRGSAERSDAAQALWDYGQVHYLTNILSILPTAQKRWEFPDDDRFLFDRREACKISTFEEWKQHLGIEPATFALAAEVTNSDWTTLVRQQAVRQQQPFNSSAFGSANILRPHCHASWDGAAWTVSFEEIAWLVVEFEDVAKVSRPAIASIQDQLLFSLAEAESKLLPKHAGKCSIRDVGEQWKDCVRQLAPLHSIVLSQDGSAKSSFHPWTRKIWNCVWPVVYREQNVLRGQADVDSVRPEIAECLATAPQMTVWMFVFAKLLSQIQTGMGLGICADFTD